MKTTHAFVICGVLLTVSACGKREEVQAEQKTEPVTIESTGMQFTYSRSPYSGKCYEHVNSTRTYEGGRIFEVACKGEEK